MIKLQIRLLTTVFTLSYMVRKIMTKTTTLPQFPCLIASICGVQMQTNQKPKNYFISIKKLQSKVSKPLSLNKISSNKFLHLKANILSLLVIKSCEVMHKIMTLLKQFFDIKDQDHNINARILRCTCFCCWSIKPPIILCGLKTFKEF